MPPKKKPPPKPPPPPKQPTTWLSHVRAYRGSHGCTYKEALQGASKTWRRQACYRASMSGASDVSNIRSHIFVAHLYQTYPHPYVNEKCIIKMMESQVTNHPYRLLYYPLNDFKTKIEPGYKKEGGMDALIQDMQKGETPRFLGQILITKGTYEEIFKILCGLCKKNDLSQTYGNKDFVLQEFEQFYITCENLIACPMTRS